MILKTNPKNSLRRFKILHLCESSETGGAETIFFEIATHIDPVRFEIYNGLFSPGWLQKQLQATNQRLEILNTKGAFDILLLLKLVRLIIKNDIDILHCHLFGAGLYGAIAGFFTKRPVVLTLHGKKDLSSKDKLKKIKIFIINKLCAKIIFVSQYLKDFYSELGLGNSSKAKVIYNGIDLKNFTPKDEPKLDYDLRKKLSLESDIFIVGCVGDVSLVKGYDDLIEVAIRIRNKLPKVHFVVAGRKTHYFEELNNRILLAGLNNIHFVGHLSCIPDFLQQIDLYLSVSISEGFSLTTVEAMAMGKMVVVTRCGGPEEIIDHGENGLLVRVGDVDDIIVSITNIINDKYDLSNILRKAQMKAINDFGIEKMIDSYQKLYVTLIESNSNTD